MSLTITAMIAALLTTGITSLVAHKLTLLAGAAAAALFGCLSLLSRNGRVYPVFVIGPLVLCVLCLVSAEQNVAPGSSAVHVLAAYAAFTGLAASTPDFSRFCRRFIFLTFGIQIIWVLVQTARVGRIETWAVSSAASGGNLVAAQIVMTLPFIFLTARSSVGFRKGFWWAAVLVGAFAVVCVGSRNGIGSLAVLIVLLALFNRKKIAVVACAVFAMVIVFLNEILLNQYVSGFLVRFRFMRFEAKNPRSLIWSICAEYIEASPWLGIGPGVSEKVLAVLEINHAHNNVIQVALESGIPAAIVAILLFAALLRIPAIALLKDRDAFVLSLPIIAYFLLSLTDNPIHHPQTTLLLAACVNEARHALQLSAARSNVGTSVLSSGMLIPNTRPLVTQ
jgi:O-antigen ligase